MTQQTITICDIKGCETPAFWDHGEFSLCQHHHEEIDWYAAEELK